MQTRISGGGGDLILVFIVTCYFFRIKYVHRKRYIIIAIMYCHFTMITALYSADLKLGDSEPKEALETHCIET